MNYQIAFIHNAIVSKQPNDGKRKTPPSSVYYKQPNGKHKTDRLRMT